MLPEDVTVTNPHKGIWRLTISGSDTKTGVVNGDAVMGYTANGDAVMGYTASNGNGDLVGWDFSSATDAVEALTTSLTAESDLR